MSSITIHGLEDPLDSLIRKKAKQEGLSLNKTIKKLLLESLELDQSAGMTKKSDFADLCGVWTDAEAQQLHKQISDLEKIDPEDWR